MLKIAKRAQGLEPASIWAIFTEVLERRRQGQNIIDMTIGAPNHGMFEESRKAAHQAIDDGWLEFYTTVDGALEVREVVAKFASLRYKSDFNSDNVLLTTASTQAIYNIFSLLVDPGDAVLITRPAYPLYAQPVEQNGGEVIHIETSKSNGFIPTKDQIREAFKKGIDPNTGKQRIVSLILDYPNNPTGAALSKAQAEDMANVLDEMLETYPDQGFAVILDDVYITLSRGAEYSIYHYGSETLRKNTFFILSSSKSLSMPGARIGSIIGDEPLIDRMKLLQAGTTNNPNGIAQQVFKSSLEVLMNSDQSASIAKYYGEKTDYVSTRLNEIAQKYGANSIPVEVKPGGAFYTLADMSFMIGRPIPKAFQSILGKEVLESDSDIARYLIAMADSECGAGVAAVPASGLDLDPKDGYLRFTCTEEQEVLEHAMSIIETAVSMQQTK